MYCNAFVQAGNKTEKQVGYCPCFTTLVKSGRRVTMVD